MPRAANPSVGLHQLPLSKAKPLSGLEKGLSLIVSGVGGGRDARRKERQEQSRKQKGEEAVQKRATAVLKNLARVLQPANGVHKLEALAAAVKRGEALQEELPKDSKLRHQLAAAIEAARAILAAIEEQQRSSAAARRASDSLKPPSRSMGGAAGGAAGRQGGGAAGAAARRQGGRENPPEDFLACLAAAEERDLKHLADCSEAAQRLLAEARGRRVDKSSAPAEKAAAAKVVGAAAAMAAGLAKRASAR